jgi:integrase
MLERAGEAAELGFKAHPHMLRHACGFALANKGHDTRSLQAYLGHRNIQHTVRYSELSEGLLALRAPTAGSLEPPPTKADKTTKGRRAVLPPGQA